MPAEPCPRCGNRWPHEPGCPERVGPMSIQEFYALAHRHPAPRAILDEPALAWEGMWEAMTDEERAQHEREMAELRRTIWET